MQCTLVLDDTFNAISVLEGEQAVQNDRIDALEARLDALESPGFVFPASCENNDAAPQNHRVVGDFLVWDTDPNDPNASPAGSAPLSNIINVSVVQPGSVYRVSVDSGAVIDDAWYFIDVNAANTCRDDFLAALSNL